MNYLARICKNKNINILQKIKMKGLQVRRMKGLLVQMGAMDNLDLVLNPLEAEEVVLSEQFNKTGKKAGKLLCKEQERELVRLYQESGDENAIEQLLKNHEGYMIRISDYYSKMTGVDKNDLLQQAKIGFVTGVQKFNLQDHKTKVLTYAAWWVLSEVQKYSILGRTIQTTPSHLSKKNGVILRHYKALMAEHKKTFGSDPLTPSQQNDIEGKLGCSLSKIEELKAIHYAPGFSLDMPLGSGDDKEITFLDVLSDERGSQLDELDRKSDARYARLLFQTAELTPSERLMIESRYLNNENNEDDTEVTLKNVGDMLGVTRERARQIEASALGKMRLMVMNNPDFLSAALGRASGSVEKLEKAGYGSRSKAAEAFDSQITNLTTVDFVRLEAVLKKINGEGAKREGAAKASDYEMAYD